MASYRKGYAAEREVMEIFEEQYHCKCIRSAGSHGSIDIIAGNGREVFAIQVKIGARKRNFYPRQLIEDAKEFNAIPIYAHKEDRKGWNFDKIISDTVQIPLRSIEEIEETKTL